MTNGRADCHLVLDWVTLQTPSLRPTDMPSTPPESLFDSFLDLPELGAGDLIAGQYRVTRQLGEGSFSRVYEAHDTRMERRVALKTVFTTGSRDHARRLRREISLIRNIEHGSVVRLYDFGQDPAGILYMAIELVEGRELVDVVREDGAFSQRRMLRVIYQVLDGLAEAHKHGVVHLDLKPENIILTEKGVRSDVVKLLDFGIARSFELQSQLGFAAATMAAGTPLYMAPEQIENRALGPHTDVYQVGLIMLELLTGAPALAGEDALTILAQRTAVPVKVPRDARVPPPLADVIERALSIDYRDRYLNALALYEALQQVADASWAPLNTSKRRVVPGPTRKPVNHVESFFSDFEDEVTGVAPVVEPEAGGLDAPARPVDSPSGAGAASGRAEDELESAPARPGSSPRQRRPRRRRTIQMSDDARVEISNVFDVAEVEPEAELELESEPAVLQGQSPRHAADAVFEEEWDLESLELDDQSGLGSERDFLAATESVRPSPATSPTPAAAAAEAMVSSTGQPPARRTVIESPRLKTVSSSRPGIRARDDAERSPSTVRRPLSSPVHADADRRSEPAPSGALRRRRARPPGPPGDEPDPSDVLEPIPPASAIRRRGPGSRARGRETPHPNSTSDQQSPPRTSDDDAPPLGAVLRRRRRRED